MKKIIKKKNRSVLVGMSGGVDSSAAVLLLQSQGYEVVGITFKMFDSNCNSAIQDAINLAKKLNIRHEVVDLTEKFNEEVIQYFLKEYENGRTPNPCVVCNRKVKFEELIRYADENSIDFVATGHYARIQKIDERYILLKAKYPEKDQSYFLYRLTQEQLRRVIFPLGEMNKDEVRDVVKGINLQISQKEDSQEVCFVCENNYQSFVKNNSEKEFEQGDIVDAQGNILGKHSGLYQYTIGQRKGLGIASNTPLFVLDIDSEKNTIVVGDEEQLYTDKFEVEDVNLIGIDELKESIEVTVKIRSTAKEADAVINKDDNNRVVVNLKQKQRAVTTGQSAVFYQGDTVIGGGVIV